MRATEKGNTVDLHLSGIIRIANYPDRLGPSSKFLENSTKLICLEITGYRIKYSTVLRLLELQIRRGIIVETQVQYIL
jgi:hypothetical protein